MANFLLWYTKRTKTYAPVTPSDEFNWEWSSGDTVLWSEPDDAMQYGT